MGKKEEHIVSLSDVGSRVVGRERHARLEGPTQRRRSQTKQFSFPKIFFSLQKSKLGLKVTQIKKKGLKMKSPA